MKKKLEALSIVAHSRSSKVPRILQVGYNPNICQTGIF